MEWIDYSLNGTALIPASVDFVWQCLVEHAYMARTSQSVVVAVTATGQAGETDHTFFMESRDEHTGVHRLFKTRVLKAEPLTVWATLTEIPGFSARQYWTLSTDASGQFTTVALHAMFHEVVPDKKLRQLAAYRAERIDHQQGHIDQDVAFFATAVAALNESAND